MSKVKLKESSVLFITQVLSYSLLVINYRAVAQAHYAWSALSDFAIASLSFFVIKKIANSADSMHLWLGYSLGGVVGSFAGIWVSLWLLGK